MLVLTRKSQNKPLHKLHYYYTGSMVGFYQYIFFILQQIFVTANVCWVWTADFAILHSALYLCATPSLTTANIIMLCTLVDDMARLAAYQASASAPNAAAAMGLPAGMDAAALQLQQLQYYRMLRTVVPQEQLERVYPAEIRERFDMALKAQVLIFCDGCLLQASAN